MSRYPLRLRKVAELRKGIPGSPRKIRDASGSRSGSGGACIYGLHEIQNHVNDGLIAERGVDHGVVDGAVRPFDVEILLNKIVALAVHGVHELLGFFLT